MSSLDFNFLRDFENGTDTLEATTEPADEGTLSLESPSAFMGTNQNLSESSSPSNSTNTDQKLLMESPRRRRKEGTARVPFLGALPKEEWEVHHRDHEKRTECRMDRVAFMEEVWTVVQSYGTQSILKLGLNRPLMREVLDKLDECEGRLSELLIDSATDKSEANSPIKMTDLLVRTPPLGASGDARFILCGKGSHRGTGKRNLRKLETECEAASRMPTKWKRPVDSFTSHNNRWLWPPQAREGADQSCRR